MTHNSIIGGDVFISGSSCGCDPDAARRQHLCTNASSLWVRVVPDAAPGLTPWVRIRSGMPIRQRCQAGDATISDINQLVEGLKQ